ncbi:MAG: ABC transporter permease [Bacteroidetes bacterium]|nr:ABC transporter permease [Bacteroidota bacterium]
MLKYIASTIKDLKLLSRDRAGLAMLFVMPLALIIIMTLLQDSTFKVLEERKLPLLVLNMDKDTFGINIVEGLKTSKFFKVVDQDGDNADAVNNLKSRVSKGEFQIGIVVNKNATELLRNNIKYNIVQQLPDEDSLVFGDIAIKLESTAKIEIYFDPITKNSFKQSITSALNEFSSGVEAKVLFGVYSSLLKKLLGMEMKNKGGLDKLVDIETMYASSDDTIVIPNSVQHNVPAWTIFAMFFIVIPLAGNIIKERESGISKRLSVIADSNMPIILGKVTTYFFVGIIQAISMLAVGVWILPLLGLPQLIIGDNYIALIILTAAVSLAASGYGVVIGSIATSQEQSSIFGSISVVILAAIGGIWVPVFMMTDLMQKVSMLSPLNWALVGYYDVLLRNANIFGILHLVIALISFFLLCIGISWFYNRKRS